MVAALGALAFLLLGHPAGSAEPVPVRAPVESFHAVVLEVFRHSSELSYDQRLARLQPALGQSFDVAFMAEKVLGRTWGELTAAQRARWVDAFGRLMASNYAARFVGFGGQRFETLGDEAGPHRTHMVQTRLVDPGGENVNLDYRLRETPGGWRIVDIYAKGTVSELALRRSEYSGVARRDGFEGLLRSVDAQIAKLAAAKPA